MNQWYFSTQKVRNCSKDLLSQLDCSILSADAYQKISICYILVNLPQVVLKFYHCLGVALQELKAVLSRLEVRAFISFVTWGILAQFANSVSSREEKRNLLSSRKE